jgi:hypothetical protein
MVSEFERAKLIKALRFTNAKISDCKSSHRTGSLFGLCFDIGYRNHFANLFQEAFAVCLRVLFL